MGFHLVNRYRRADQLLKVADRPVVRLNDLGRTTGTTSLGTYYVLW